MTRSLVSIELTDLERLARLAQSDIDDLFSRKSDTARLYRGKAFAIALCQGAAIHYIDQKNGVKDFDVWVFFAESSERQFPYRRRGIADFGIPKFGKTDDSPNFVGRRVDIIGRSLRNVDTSDPIKTIQGYLQAGGTTSARLLSQKAVVLIWPSQHLGEIVW